MKDVEAIEGLKFDLAVRLSDCFPVPKGEWFKNDEPFVADDNHKIETVNADYKLSVLNATETDEAKYTFKASNELGPVESSCKATVLVKPIFVKQFEPKIAKNLTGTANCEFEVKSKPASTFKIFKDNKEIKSSDKINVEKTATSDMSYSLNIKNLDSNDAGLYKVVATNKSGSTSSNEIELTVTGAACITKKPNAHVFVPEKKQAKIEFEVAGIPAPEVTW